MLVDITLTGLDYMEELQNDYDLPHKDRTKAFDLGILLTLQAEGELDLESLTQGRTSEYPSRSIEGKRDAVRRLFEAGYIEEVN